MKRVFTFLLTSLAFLHAAVAAIVVNLSDADPTKCYSVTTMGRGGWAVDAAGTMLTCTNAEGLTVDDTDARQQFAILSLNGEDYYLYSVSAKKFVAMNRALVAGKTDAIELVDASSMGEGRVLVRFDVNHNINVAGSNLVIDTWSYLDAGNAVAILEAGDFDASEALAMLAAEPEEEEEFACEIVCPRGPEGWIEGADWYNVDMRVMGYSSPIYHFAGKVETFRIIVKGSKNNQAFFCLSELELYDADGQKIPLTAANVASNADHNTLNPESLDGGGFAALFDEDLNTYFHSAWQNMPIGEHYLEVTLPNGGYDTFSFTMLSRSNSGGRDQSHTFPGEMALVSSVELSSIEIPEVPEIPGDDDEPVESVTSLSDADPTKCYSISTTTRGAWAVDSAGIRFSTTGVEGYIVDVSDPNQQFAILSANGEDYYLYSVSAKKFVKRNCSLVAGVADAIEFVDASSWEEGRVMVRFRDYANANINIGGSNQIAINSWDIIDAGNAVLISEAGDFDATEALDMLLDSVAPADPDAPVFTEKVDAAMPLEFLPNADGWVEGTEWYDEENSIVGYTSPMYRFEEKVETFRIVVMRSQAKEAFFCLSELAFYDANGVKIELTEANVTSNADHNALNPTNPDGGGIAALFDGDIGTYFHSAWKNFPDEVHYLEVTLPNGGYDAFGFRMLSRAKDGINDQSITFPRRMLITDGDYQRLALEGLLAETGTFNLYPFPEIGYYYDDLGYFHDAISRGQDMVESGASESECGAAIAELMQAFRQYDQNESIRLPEPGKPYRFISAFPGFDVNQSVEKAISVDTLQNRLWWETVSGDNQLQEFVLEPVLDRYGNPRSWLFTIHFNNGKKVMETQYYYTMQNVATGLYVNYSTADGFHLTEQPSVVYVTPLGYGQFGIRALLANANGGNSVYCASVGYHNGGIPADSVDYFGGVPGVNSVLGSSYGEKYSPSSWFIREVQELPYAMSVSEEEFKSGFVHFEATDVVTLTADKDCSFADLKFYSPYYYNRNISVEKCELSGNIATITLDRKVTACAFEFDNYEGVSSITFNAEAQVEEPDTVPSLEMIFAYPESDVPVSRADFVKLLFNKEVTLALPEEGIVVRGATTGAEFTIREGRVIEDMNGWHVLLYFLDEKGAYDAVDVADTYTYTIPAGVIQSADGEEYPETIFTFSIYETFPLISYYPTECSVLETIVLTFDRAVAEVVMPTEGLTVTDIYYTPVAKVKRDVIISEDMKTVTLELESPITTPGWYYLDLYTGVFLDEQGMGNSYESLVFEVYEDTSSDPILGDVNSDGQLTMMDVVMQVNAVLNISQEGYDVSVADMNGDGQITIIDVVAVVRLVLGYEPVAAARGMNREASSVALEAGDVSLTAEGELVLPIYMHNTAAYTAFQVDVVLPEGMTLSHATLGERAKSSHSIAWNTLDNGATRIVAYAMNNAEFKDNDGSLMLLTLEADAASDGAMLELVDGLFATANGGEDCAADLSVMMRSETTGVDNLSGVIRASGVEGGVMIESAGIVVVDIYSLTGQLVQSVTVSEGTSVVALPAGIYIVNNQKIIIK